MHRCRVIRSWPLTGVDEAGGEFGNYLGQSRFGVPRSCPAKTGPRDHNAAMMTLTRMPHAPMPGDPELAATSVPDATGRKVRVSTAMTVLFSPRSRMRSPGMNSRTM
jgi:hypothetical protein